MRRPIVARNVPRRLNDIVAYVQFVADSLRDNPFFPSPPVPIATFDAHVAALRAAQSAVLSRTKGTAEDRNAKLAKVLSDLEGLRTYVQGVAESTPGNPAQIVLSAGMYLKKPGLYDKPRLRVLLGPASGRARLVAKSAGDRASYEWQYAPVPGAWIDSAPTRQAQADVAGLTPGLTYLFRFRALTKSGLGDWSQVVSARME